MGKKILIIDDDESIAEVIQIVLEGEGYNIETSQDGGCIPNFVTGLPNLILLDMLLQGEDGREICKQLKSDQRTASIPIIMLSAHSDAGQVADASGADDFLEKPFDVDVLISIVEKYVQRDDFDTPKIGEALS